MSYQIYVVNCIGPKPTRTLSGIKNTSSSNPLLVKLSEPPQRATTIETCSNSRHPAGHTWQFGTWQRRRPRERRRRSSQVARRARTQRGHTWQLPPSATRPHTHAGEDPEPEILGPDEEKGQTQSNQT